MWKALLTNALLIVAATSLASPACTDPVHDQEVSALGPEYPGVPPSQYHRPGQPCTVCHGPEGPAQTQFSVAGTIFWNPYQALTSAGIQGSVGANGVTVSVVDDSARQKQVTTNCVGNFWITPQDFPAQFPLEALIFFQDGSTLYQETMGVNLISRAGSCAECHADPPNYNALGHVYLNPTTAEPSDQSSVMCPVNPDLSQQGSSIP